MPLRCIERVGRLRHRARVQTPSLEQQTQRGAAYLSGGVGVDEVQAMRSQANNYNLKLVFAVAGSGEYLADVKVSVADASGNNVIHAVSNGPLFGKTQSRTVTLRAGQRADLNFFWPSARSPLRARRAISRPAFRWGRQERACSTPAELRRLCSLGTRTRARVRAHSCV